MLLPFHKLCHLNKVPAEIVLIESDDIAKSISMVIAKGAIKDLVIGASSSGLFSRKIKGQALAPAISECAPSFCTVYVVYKGKLESLRPSDSVPSVSIAGESGSSSSSSSDSSTYTSATLDPWSAASDSPLTSFSLSKKRLESLPEITHRLHNLRKESTELNNFRSLDPREEEDVTSSATVNSAIGSPNGQVSRSKSFGAESESQNSDQASTSASPKLTSSEAQMHTDLEIEKLKIELRHIRGMLAIAENEKTDACRRISDLSKLQLEEAMKLKEIEDKEEKAKELARLEKEKAEAALKEAEHAWGCAQREASQRRVAEMKAAREAREKEKLKNVLTGPICQYQKFTWEEITSATSSFSEDLKIGMGSYGTVYKCKLHHTNVAVKVLHSKEGSQSKQFQQELEVLSKIRHPNVLLLLGACPEEGCLVYEYMDNGSLEDRLFCKNNTPPIPWYDRYRIAWEVASALAFLHNTKPEPIIHRDLKPANILLDHHLVSKIGDAGLCTMLNLDPSSMTMATRTLYKDTSPVGTLCYIDPEYQRTGLISTKSDVYALGMVILQLLTAKPAVGITHMVESAIDEGHLMQILDKDAGKWPVRETTEMALLGLQCAELRRRDRPDLKDKVLPVLERLKDIPDGARDLPSGRLVTPPGHFICPILKDLMEEPCVAADGYTYDRKAIELWLKDNDTSPTTNFPLSNKNLIPNYTLLYAIMEWKTRRRSRSNSLRSNGSARSSSSFRSK
ncbi:hypothetical protein Ancab_010314 [Ancistrocladus abbreviatus]